MGLSLRDRTQKPLADSAAEDSLADGASPDLGNMKVCINLGKTSQRPPGRRTDPSTII